MGESQTVDKIELYLGFVYFLFFQVRALSDTLSLRGTPRSGPSSQAFCKDFPPHSDAVASELRGQVFCTSLLLALSSVFAYGLTDRLRQGTLRSSALTKSRFGGKAILPPKNAKRRLPARPSFAARFIRRLIARNKGNNYP